MITQWRTGQSSTQTHILLITIKNGKFLMVLFVVVILLGWVFFLFLFCLLFFFEGGCCFLFVCCCCCFFVFFFCFFFGGGGMFLFPAVLFVLNSMNKLYCCYSFSYDLSCIQFNEIVWMVKGNNWLQRAHG